MGLDESLAEVHNDLHFIRRKGLDGYKVLEGLEAPLVSTECGIVCRFGSPTILSWGEVDLAHPTLCYPLLSGTDLVDSNILLRPK